MTNRILSILVTCFLIGCGSSNTDAFGQGPYSGGSSGSDSGGSFSNDSGSSSGGSKLNHLGTGGSNSGSGGQEMGTGGVENDGGPDTGGTTSTGGTGSGGTLDTGGDSGSGGKISTGGVTGTGGTGSGGTLSSGGSVGSGGSSTGGGSSGDSGSGGASVCDSGTNSCVQCVADPINDAAECAKAGWECGTLTVKDSCGQDHGSNCIPNTTYVGTHPYCSPQHKAFGCIVSSNYSEATFCANLNSGKTPVAKICNDNSGNQVSVTDGQKDYDETDPGTTGSNPLQDCGGSLSPIRCAAGQACLIGTDCINYSSAFGNIACQDNNAACKPGDLNCKCVNGGIIDSAYVNCAPISGSVGASSYCCPPSN